jgi:RNA polymerase sigma-70 factor (ECF subfamily)
MENISDKFMTIFKANKDRLYNYIIRMVNDREAARDISQETFIRLYTNLKNNITVENHAGWLMTVARNLSLNRIRDRKREIPLENDNDSDYSVDNNIDPRHIALKKAMHNLNPKYRELIILKEYEGYSYDGISKITNMTPTAVKAALYKARIQLKGNYDAIMKGGSEYVL